ncbi:hypothetical protein [Streptomyces sp. NPDC097619]|uniref:hypothetical protein n=1 Tax=Streptomyces sp. NPDC097619 TaxID=3157228 RepID=UPI00332D1C64
MAQAVEKLSRLAMAQNTQNASAIASLAEFQQQQRVFGISMLQTAASAARHASRTPIPTNVHITYAAALAASQRSTVERASILRPLLESRFPSEIIDLATEALEAAENLDEAEDCLNNSGTIEEIPDELVEEIEAAFSDISGAIVDLPPHMQRALFVWFIRLLVFSLACHAIIVIPAGMEVLAILGAGALDAARVAGDAAGSEWDKRFGPPSSAEETGDT